MGMHRMAGLFMVVPVTMILTVSFFVLFALRKIESAGLKTFGYVIAALLWLGALLVFSSGAYSLATGKRGMPGCMMMQEKMHKMGGQMPEAMHQETGGMMKQ